MEGLPSSWWSVADFLPTSIPTSLPIVGFPSGGKSSTREYRGVSILWVDHFFVICTIPWSNTREHRGMSRAPVFWGSSVEEKCCIVHVSFINHTVLRNVRVKMRNSGGGNGIGGGTVCWDGLSPVVTILPWLQHGSHLAFVIKLVIAMQSLQLFECILLWQIFTTTYWGGWKKSHLQVERTYWTSLYIENIKINLVNTFFVSYKEKRHHKNLMTLNCPKASEIQTSRFDRFLICSLGVLPIFCPKNCFEAVLNLAAKWSKLLQAVKVWREALMTWCFFLGNFDTNWRTAHWVRSSPLWKSLWVI